MTRILSTLLILLAALRPAFATEFTSTVLKPGEDGRLAFEKVVEVNGAGKDQLYTRMKAWVKENVKTEDNNIEFDDAGKELIVTTPTLALKDLKMKHVTNQHVNFKLKLQFKEGRMRILASSFQYFGIDINRNIHTEPLEDVSFKRIMPNPLKQIGPIFDETFSAFVAAIEKAAVQSEARTSDW